MTGKKILILGASSYIGRHLFKRLGPEKAIGTYNNTPIKHGIKFDSISMKISDIIHDPSMISHAIILLGDTNPDSCAEDVKRSTQLNVDSIKSIIQQLVKWKIKPVFTSSEFIFDGKKGDYTEYDLPMPILIYGKQKVQIEEYIQKSCNDFIIGRLTKVFGSDINDDTLFTKWIKETKKNEGKDFIIKCASDQIFSPLYIDDIVNALIKLVNLDCKGIFHIASIKSYSRLELLNMLIKHAKKYRDIKIKIIPCSIHDFHLKERRPLNISMNPGKLIETTGIKLHDVETVCKMIVEKYLKT